jgi:hypothetical protein
VADGLIHVALLTSLNESIRQGVLMAFPLMRQSAEVTKNSKSQISNNKQITMTKIQNSKPVLAI